MRMGAEMRREYTGDRVHTLQVRLTPKEYDRLIRAASKADMTISAYVRSLISIPPKRRRRP